MSDVNRRTGRSIGAVAAFTLATTGLVALPAGATTNEDGTITLDIVAITDFHGHIENAAQLDNMIKEIRANNETDTIFAANGDNVGGSAYISAIDNDNPTMSILTAMGLQVSSAGNHEFDKGYDDLVGRIAENVGWPYLLTNVSPIDDRMIPPYEIITTDSGVRVGFVGSVTADLPTLVAPSGIEGLTITDPVESVNAQAAELKDGDESNGEADVVVALIHETAGKAKNASADIDAVVAGHTHHQVEDSTASGAPVLEAGSFGEVFGHYTLTLDAETKQVVSTDAKIVEVPKLDCAADPDANPDICGLFVEAQETATELGAQPVGTIIGGADRGTDDGTEARLGWHRGTETVAGNLIAESFYDYAKSIDRPVSFAIMNPGGVRADLDPNRDGVVTAEESFSMQPFGNEYATVDITPAQVYTLLEQQWADESSQTWLPVQQLGFSKNISYTYAAEAAFGQHIKTVFIDGEALDRNDTTTLLTVASNAYLATGGDGYNVLKDGQNFLTNGMIDVDVFNEYLGRNPGLVVDYSQRNISVSGEDALMAGRAARLELGSLSMTWPTEQQPLPTVVELRYGNAILAEAPIDNTINPTLNETGTATVLFEVPGMLEPGVHEFTVVAGPTTMKVPVTVVDSGGTSVVTPLPGTEGNVLFASDWTNPVATHANTVDPAEEVHVGYLNDPDVQTFMTRNGNEYTIHSTNRVDSINYTVPFGEASDDFLVGNFTGDEYSIVAVRKAGTNEISVYWEGPETPSVTFRFGRPGDELVVGDWDGDGTDTIGVKRGNKFFLRNELSGGNADQSFTFGRADDKALAGDFDGDGVDTISIVRGNSVYLKNALEGGTADSVFTFGRATDIHVVGDFFGTGVDTLAVVRW
ncbi:MAG: bifunctional UDP-sugar hydrolase/5'-nucleotidase [Ancrocorticia sp.]